MRGTRLTVALWIAFSLSRRARSDKYPYGFHRAEDLAGLFVLLVMTASAGAAGYGSLRHLITGEHPDPDRAARLGKGIGRIHRTERCEWTIPLTQGHLSDQNCCISGRGT